MLAFVKRPLNSCNTKVSIRMNHYIRSQSHAVRRVQSIEHALWRSTHGDLGCRLEALVVTAGCCSRLSAASAWLNSRFTRPSILLNHIWTSMQGNGM
jgi:hypothetical protein